MERSRLVQLVWLVGSALVGCSSGPPADNGTPTPAVVGVAGGSGGGGSGGSVGIGGAAGGGGGVGGVAGTAGTAGASGAAGAAMGAALVPFTRAQYAEKLEGFWLGQCIANWTGLITELDKDGVAQKKFYTDESWGGPDAPTIYGKKSEHATIDFVFENPGGVWRSDDDTDIEYIYWFAADQLATARLSGAQIRTAWLEHIYKETEETPWGVADKYSLPLPQQNDGKTYYENKLWVSNETAFRIVQRMRNHEQQTTVFRSSSCYVRMKQP